MFNTLIANNPAIFIIDQEERNAVNRKKYLKNRYHNDPDFKEHKRQQGLKNYYIRKEKKRLEALEAQQQQAQQVN